MAHLVLPHPQADPSEKIKRAILAKAFNNLDNLKFNN
jgi:hypothetical protein